MSEEILKQDPLLEVEDKYNEYQSQGYHDIQIDLYKLTKGKKFGYLDNITYDEIDYEVLRNQYGAGKYKIRLSGKKQEDKKTSSFTWDSREIDLIEVEKDKAYVVEEKNDDIVAVIAEMKDWLMSYQQNQQMYFEKLAEMQNTYMQQMLSLQNKRAEDKTLSEAFSNLTNLLQTNVKENRQDNTIVVEAIRQLGSILPALLNRSTSDNTSQVIAELIKQNAEIQRQVMFSSSKKTDWTQILQIALNAVDIISDKLKQNVDNPAVAIINNIADIVQAVLPQLLQMKVKPSLTASSVNDTAMANTDLNTEAKAEASQTSAYQQFIEELNSRKVFDLDPQMIANQLKNQEDQQTIDWILNNHSEIIKYLMPSQRNWFKEFFETLKNGRLLS